MGRKVFKVNPAAKSKLNFDQKQFVQQSSRPIGTDTFWTGVDDDDSYIENVHAIGDAVAQVRYSDFNCMDNETYIHEAMVQWDGAARDAITGEIVNKITTTQAGVDTDFNIDPVSGFVVAAAGDGVIEIVNHYLVEVVMDQDNGKPLLPGYWDCGMNGTKTAFDFTTLTFKPDGNGGFNMMTTELILARFVRKVSLMGKTSGWNILPSSDTAKIGIGTRLKLTFETRGVDHDWQSSVSLIMHRSKLQ